MPSSPLHFFSSHQDNVAVDFDISLFLSGDETQRTALKDILSQRIQHLFFIQKSMDDILTEVGMYKKLCKEYGCDELSLFVSKELHRHLLAKTNGGTQNRVT